MAKFVIASYNSTGLGGNKKDFIKFLLDDVTCDIMLLQETWLLDSNLDSLGDIHEKYLFHAVSGVPKNELLTGRPHGGVGILWKKTIAKFVTPVEVLNNRVCAVTVQDGNRGLLIINGYLPVDTQSRTQVSDLMFDTMDAIEQLLERFPNFEVIFGGDMNADLTRTTAHVSCLKAFINRVHLQTVWDLDIATQEYTYVNHNFSSGSCIDHYLVSTSTIEKLSSCYVYNSSLNLSNHNPIVLVCNLSVGSTLENVFTKRKVPTLQWHRIYSNPQLIQLYNEKLACLLDNMNYEELLHCTNISCDNASHQFMIDNLCDDITDCCIVAGDFLPEVKSKPNNLPGWNTDVKPCQMENSFWHNTWVKAGKPTEGLIYDNMKEARRCYKYAVRAAKKQEAGLRFQQMARAVSQNKTRDFFKELKKMSPKTPTPPNIAGKTDPKDIAEHFAMKYKALYNSVKSDPESMQDISKQIYLQLLSCSYEDVAVTSELVEKVIGMLKHEKNDGHKGLSSSHLIIGKHTVSPYIAKLLTAIMIHGYQPQALLIATISSIPKNRRSNLCDDSNYRGIALSSAIGKILDIIFLIKNETQLKTSELQFAFKKKHGTALCTAVVKDTVDYYLRHGSPVYGCLLDLTKAFDRVRFDCLFMMLIRRGVSPLYIRALLDLYNRQEVRTVWRNAHSETFPAENGIRQGSIASPILFTIYMDDLIKQLEIDGTGCWRGPYFMGAICYADDIILLCPSVKGLRHMLDTCNNFAQGHGMKFNPSKSECIKFGGKPGHLPSMYLEGHSLLWKDSVKHLGNILNSGLNDIDDMLRKRGDLFSRVNLLEAHISNAPDAVKLAVFNSKCCHFYGCETWCLDNKHVQVFWTAWNRCVRKILKLHPRTHRRLLPILAGTPPAEFQVCRRYATMLRTMGNNSNRRLLYIFMCGTKDSSSIIGRNISHLRQLRGNVDGGVLMKIPFEPNKEDSSSAATILELRSILRKESTLETIDNDTIQFMIDFICTQ